MVCVFIGQNSSNIPLGDVNWLSHVLFFQPVDFEEHAGMKIGVAVSNVAPAVGDGGGGEGKGEGGGVLVLEQGQDLVNG